MRACGKGGARRGQGYPHVIVHENVTCSRGPAILKKAGTEKYSLPVVHRYGGVNRKGTEGTVYYIPAVRTVSTWSGEGKLEAYYCCRE